MNHGPHTSRSVEQPKVIHDKLHELVSFKVETELGVLTRLPENRLLSSLSPVLSKMTCPSAILSLVQKTKQVGIEGLSSYPYASYDNDRTAASKSLSCIDRERQCSRQRRGIDTASP